MKHPYALFVPICLLMISCVDNQPAPLVRNIADLKRGEVVSCGPADGEVFGTVSFTASVPEKLREDFNVGVALLHSFEYDEAEKMFARVIDNAPDCAMAYWGVAMSNFHSLWAPPSPTELKVGTEAIAIARSLGKTSRENDYIEAIGKFYDEADKLSHKERITRFANAMEQLYKQYTDDLEAAVFYALALNASADPTDKTYTNQKKAVGILQPVYNKQPMHPGVAHYIIHNCDYPELAAMALPAARKYAAIAPGSAHAQHMPSHIFTRLGLWQECINSNLVSANSAKCYAEKAKMKGHWDEELHAMDYLVYAYLQMGKVDSAKNQVDYLRTIQEVQPSNFKTAYAFAAIPARYILERQNWEEAAAYQAHPANYPWEKYPWQKSIIHFTRLMGNVHTGNLTMAKAELIEIKKLHETLAAKKEKAIEARQVEIQLMAAEAWINLRSGNHAKAVELMTAAADMEDRFEKHPVTPGEVVPARELLGEMLMELKRPAEALAEFELDLKSHPERLKALKGAGLAAKAAGDQQKARVYHEKIIAFAKTK